MKWKQLCEKNTFCHWNDLKMKICMIKIKSTRRLIQSERNLILKYLLTFWKWWEKDFVLHDLFEEWIKETLIQSRKDYVCSLAHVIQFYQLSSEFNWEFNESKHKCDSAVRECIATFRSDNMNICNSFEHSETSTFIV